MKSRGISALIMILAAVMLACNLPFLSPTPENIFRQPAQTLTAMVQQLKTSTAIIINPTLQPPTLTSNPVIIQQPTFTPIPTWLPTYTRIPTLQPTFDTLPTQPGGPYRKGNFVTARYLAIPPILDGNWDEWVNLTPIHLAGYVINGASFWKNAADLNADFIMGWDNQYLYLGAKIIDDVYVQNSTGAYIYKGDDIELQLDTNLDVDFYVKSMNNDDYQLGISAGRGSLAGLKEAYLWYSKIIQASITNQVLIASRAESGFHFVEARIPWSLFSVSPYAGLRMGFALGLSDNDDPSANNWQTFMANTPGRKTTDPTTWGELHLTM
jgi:hypothetical protein